MIDSVRGATTKYFFALVMILTAVFALTTLQAYAAEDSVSATATVSAELRATIMSAVTSDPRADSLTPDQLNNLVDILAQSAAESNVQPREISIGTIKESPYSNGGEAVACGVFPAWLCVASESLGFIGNDPSWPLLLGVLALVLLLIGVLIKIHHKRTGVHPLL